MRATSRLTFWTSSSESCCSSSALACSPRTIRSMAALRRPGRDSVSCLEAVALRIMLQLSSSRIQVRRIWAEISGSLEIFSRRCLARTSAVLVMTGASYERVQRLRVDLLLQRFALSQLGFDLLFDGRAFDGRNVAGRLSGGYRGRSGDLRGPAAPAALRQHPYGRHQEQQQARGGSSGDCHGLAVPAHGDAERPGGRGRRGRGRGRRRLDLESRFERQRLNDQLIAPFGVEPGDAGDQVADNLDLFRGWAVPARAACRSCSFPR